MALNTIGRILYFDAPATFNAAVEAGRSVKISQIILRAAAGAAATLDVYAGPTVVAATKIVGMNAAVSTFETLGGDIDETLVPLSRDGLTVVLGGAGSEAWIWLA